MPPPFGRGRAALGAAALAALVAGACARGTEAPRRWNVVVVLVDTLRADRLSLYGYERPTTPALDRFARERGVVFRDAWANAGCTFPSVNSILTGIWPQRFLAGIDKNGMAIPPELPTLAERLAAHGWATAAVSASVIARASPSVINKQGGFGAGFAAFDERCLNESAACVNARASALLGALREPFLLFLHYLDPHQPYRPPAGVERRFSAASREAAARWARRGDPETIYRQLYGGDARAAFTAADTRHLSDLYDDEIRYLDGKLDELLAELTRSGRLERTIVVFLSDHGEELLDHGNWGHCRDLAYSTLFATPLVVAVPGLPPGERRTPVENVDLVPTLLDLLGIPAGAQPLDGASRRGLLEKGDDPASAARTLFAAQGRMRAARDARRLLRLDLSDGRETLFPFDRRDPAFAAGAAPGATANELRRALVDWIRRVEGEGSAAEALRHADALERDLRALGYL
jgi:arylsulfatase A-like enzyme